MRRYLTERALTRQGSPFLLLAVVILFQTFLEEVSSYDAHNLFFLSLIVFTSLFHEKRISILLIIASTAANWFFFQEPKFSINILPSNAIEITVFFLLGLAINFVIQSFKKKQYKLSLLNERFRMALKGASEGTLMSDGTGKFVFVSDAVQKILGYSPDEYLSINPYTLIHPEDQAEVLFRVQEFKKVSDADITLEYRHRHKSGQWIWLEVTLSNFLYDPSVSSIFCRFKSIDQRKQHEQERSDFINFAAHEFKTPLTVIKAYSQALMGKQAEEKSISALKIIEKQANNLSAIVQNYLNASKGKQSQQSLKLESCDLTQLVTELVQTIEMSQKNHEIISRITNNIIVEGDQEKLRQVMVNYMTNAIKYSPQAHLIEVNLEKDTTSATFSVTDFGFGIDEKDQKLIFDKYYRVDESKEIDGTGFGLYISSQIIQLHRGEVGVISKPNVGSTFWFKIPLPGDSQLQHDLQSLELDTLK